MSGSRGSPFPVLIVDDDELSIDVLGSTLRSDGYQVVVARSGPEAIEILETTACRLLISDWVMPDMDGLELCRRVRDLRLHEYVYIILVTSKEETDDVVDALTAGADDFLTKPFNPAELRVRVRTGERIRRSRDDLEAMVSQRTAELTRSNKELEQFASVASHDLQEPLRMVSSYLQLLERRYRSSLDADAVEFIEYAVAGAARMKRLIEDLLAFSRVSSRAAEPGRSSCEAALARAIENLEVAITESGAVVTNGPLPVVEADEFQLVQLFQNLVGNAIKYRSPDRVPEVHIESEAQDGVWRLSIHDNGIGIEPQFAERVFVLFQRLHGRDEYTGTGIGLALCKKIVERHGGRIWIEPRPGPGVSVCLTLPKLAEENTHERAAVLHAH